MKPLLLLVDFQFDFLTESTLEPSAGVVIERAATLLEECRSRKLPVIHVQTTVSKEKDERMPHWKTADRWRCVAETQGHEPPPALSPLDRETVVHKTGFSGFQSPDLLNEIHAKGADTIILAGVHLHACVRQTAIDAYQQGFQVVIAEDAVASDDPVHAAITKRYLEQRCIPFRTVDSILSHIDGTTAASTVSSRIEETIEQAASYFRKTEPLSAEARMQLVEALASKIEENRSELASLITGEIGKPIYYSKIELQITVEMLHDLVRCFESLNQEEDFGPATVRYRPHGVVAIITPFNNPMYIALGKVVPAILYGNAVVWKPAPTARQISQRLIGIMKDSGWPEGMVVLLEGGRSEATALMSDKRISAVTLTGSSEAGYAAKEICARRSIPLQAELGGNNASIVWPDADLEGAAHKVASGAFEMSGQRCTANRRVIVHQDCYDGFLELLIAATGKLKWGNPENENTRIGPVISERQQLKILSMTKRAEATGSSVIYPLGTDAPAIDGYWVPPTIIRCNNPTAEIVQEETFGPVLIVQTANTWEHAITLCNGVRQGLAASVFTGSQDLKDRFLNEAQAGILKINQATSDARIGIPFGGWKASGIGVPEHGRYDREFYTRPQTIYR